MMCAAIAVKIRAASDEEVSTSGSPLSPPAATAGSIGI